MRDRYVIPLEAVESSSLAAIGYDPEKQILAVQFTSGEIYHVAGVSLKTALELYNAESKGRYYAEQIRGRYWSERMTGICPACGDSGWVNDRCVDCGCDVYHVVPRNPRPVKHENARQCGCDPAARWVCPDCRQAS